MTKRGSRFGATGSMLVGMALVVGCDKKEEASATVAPAASAVAPSVAPPTAMVVRYAIDPAGKTSIDMPAPKEHIKADTSGAGGELQIDLTNLANTRGEVKVDVATLKTHTFDDASKDTKQTEHALTWLEVGDQVTPEVREKNRWVTFAIRSIDGASASELTKVAPEKSADGEVRTVTLTAHGEFLLHGHKVGKDAALEIRFHSPAGAAAGAKPALVDVTTKAPLHIVLAEHEVKPRDNLGSIAQSAFGLLGTKVAETADVTLDLHAKPAP
jgi:hypothetical protein